MTKLSRKYLLTLEKNCLDFSSADVRVKQLSFYCDGKEEKCALAVASLKEFCVDDSRDQLSDIELKKLSSLSSEIRKKEYALGRITTKKALNLLAGGDLKFQEISVTNEKSGRPIIENFDYSTSITHTNETVASLVFKKEFSFGIDIEKLRPKSIEALKSATFDKERVSSDLTSLTAAWTLKESLSKALNCGFSRPFEEFELSQFNQKEDSFLCSYAKHRKFKGVAKNCGENFCAIAYPAHINFNESQINFLESA
ncbi:MAG: 4'-phosphopantetheinyl transferase superfamily protein [Holosporaceae bacterium]|jgi:phosphopantetheinyl transferase|nr:4'-phosphopantetheinyl transferase superfamily protein [Holosporaceae bacterium]